MKTEQKTRVTDASVEEFLDAISDESQRGDCRAVVDLMSRATGEEPTMWAGGIIGFGRYHYCGKSNREGDWFFVGISPRKQALTFYLMGGFDHDLLQQLGKHTLGKGCLYIKRLSDVDVSVLEKLIVASVRSIREELKGEAGDHSKTTA